MIIFKNNKIVKFSNRIKDKDATLAAYAAKLKELSDYIVINKINTDLGKPKKKKVSDAPSPTENIEESYNIDNILNEIADNGGSTDNIDPKKLEFLRKFKDNK
jgi:hypothetical protein